MTDRLTRALREWISTRTWDQSQAFAAAHADDLLDTTTLSILARFAKRDLRDHTLRLHRGLLGCAASADFDTAYALLADPAQCRAVLAEPDLPPGTRLALARLHSGQATDDSDAHFQLAVITLLAGHPDETTAVLADCADNAAPLRTARLRAPPPRGDRGPTPASGHHRRARTDPPVPAGKPTR
jgi:hypothetical protein